MLRSTVRAALSLLALALLPLAAAAPAGAAPAPRAARVVEAVAGERVTIAGAVPQRVRRPAVLQQRREGHWRPVARARTTRSGRFAFGRPASATAYRVVAPATTVGHHRLRRWTSRPTTVRLFAQRGTVTTPPTVRPGTRVVARASFAPARPGRPVALQALRSGSWRTVATAAQDARGRATFRDAVAASTTYRAVALAWRGAAAVTTTSDTTTTQAYEQDGPWVTGYYAGWFYQWLYGPEQVDMSAMTHFVFGRVAPGGGSLGGQPGEVEWGAVSAQEPGGAPDGSGRSVEDYLVDRAHASGTKAVLMLGGDGLDGAGFMRSTTDAVRPTFVRNVVDHLVAHDYDGVDIDWENCLEGAAGCGEPDGADPVPAAEARRRLQELIADIRTETAERARYATTPALVTFPGYAVKINEIEDGRVEQWQADVANAVDQYNLMTYGIGTTWNGAGWLSWFSGALTGASGQTPVDISSSVDAYVATGVPRDRIGIGIGFYGIYYGPKVTGPRQSTEDNDVYETQDAALAYSELDRMGYLSHGTRHWDEEAQSTYRTYPELGDGGFVPEPEGELPPRHPAGMLSYEDEQSIAAKGDFVRETGVGGTILWTINYGWLPGSGTNPLLDAVKSSFLG